MFALRKRSLDLTRKRELFYLLNVNLHNVTKQNTFSTSGLKSITQSSSVSIPTLKKDNPELWVNSKINDIQPCVGLTVPEFIRENIRGWEDAVAFECAATGSKYTHRQVLQNSRGFAASLLKADARFQKGDVVAIMTHNIPEYCAILFGIWEAGLVPTTINPAYTIYEVKKQLESCHPKAIVTLPDYLSIARAAKSEFPFLKSIIIVGEAHEGCHTYKEMVKTDPTGVNFLKGSQINTETELALLPFSSGTTGLPKGVMLTHSSLASNILQMNHPLFSNMPHYSTTTGDQVRLVGLLPFFHSYALVCILIMTMWKGASTMCLPKFKPEAFIDVLGRHKPTFLHVVPPIIQFLVQHEGVTKEKLKCVETVLGGAAPFGPAQINQLLDKAGKFLLFQEGYGMTELSPVSHCIPFNIQNTKIGSCGMPVPLTMTKIVDVESGKTLPRFEKGELCVKGPQVMKGYLNNEEATRNTIDTDGWLHTGDIGYYDNDDFLYIVDRLKELIKVKGFQVAPSELEDLLRSHEMVTDVAVIGVPHEESGEVPRAYIVQKESTELSVENIQNFVQNKVATYKQLKGGIEFVKEIPKAASGKILRRELLKDYCKNYGLDYGLLYM